MNGMTKTIKVARMGAQEKNDVLQPQVDGVLKDAVASSSGSPLVHIDQIVQSSEKIQLVTQQL